MHPMIAELAQLQVEDRIASSATQVRIRRLAAARRRDRRVRTASLQARRALVLATPTR